METQNSTRVQEEQDTLLPGFSARPEEREAANLCLGLRLCPDPESNEETTYQQMAHCLPGLLWMVNPRDRSIEYLNAGFALAWGYNKSSIEVPEEVWFARVHPDDLAAVRHASRPRDTPLECTFRTRAADGSWRWLQARWSPLADAQGNTRQVIGYAEDLTRIKELQDSVLRLNEMIQEARLQERRRIARELHDGTGQDFADLALSLGMIELRLPHLDECLQQLLAESRSKLETCTRNLAAYTHLHHPPLLTSLGFVRALRHFVHGFATRTGILTRLSLSEEFPRLSAEVESGLFRVLQEALNNVFKHSGSGRARVSVLATERLVTLQVRDFGKGFRCDLNGRMEEPCLGVGLLGMKERVELLGGWLQVESNHTGTRVVAVLRRERNQATSGL